jgi:hypothetical protein
VTAESLASSASTDAVIAVIVGVAVGAGAVAFTRWRDSRGGQEDAESPDWTTIFPSHSGEPTVVVRSITEAESQETGKLVLAGVIALIVAIAYLATLPRLMTSLAFLLAGLGLGVSACALLLPRAGRHLAPGAGQATARSVAVSGIAAICLAWTLHTTYRQVSLAKIRFTVVGVAFRHKPTVLNNAFHDPAWWLVASLGVGAFLAVMAALLSIWTGLAAVAMTRVGFGERRRLSMFLAKFHTEAQAGQWTRSVILMACAFVLCSGLVLHWTDPSAHIHIDSGSTTSKAAPPSSVTIPATPARGDTASAVCGRIDRLPVDGKSLLSRLGESDGPALKHSRPAALRGTTGSNDWYVTTGAKDAGVSCLYRDVADPSVAMRIYYDDATAEHQREAAAKKADATLVGGTRSDAQLPHAAGSEMARVVAAALPSIRYGP